MTDPYFISAMENIISFISKHENIRFKFSSEIGEYKEKELKTNIFPYLLGLNKKIVKSYLRKATKTLVRE